MPNPATKPEVIEKRSAISPISLVYPVLARKKSPASSVTAFSMRSCAKLLHCSPFRSEPLYVFPKSGRHRYEIFSGAHVIGRWSIGKLQYLGGLDTFLPFASYLIAATSENRTSLH